jgi:hypothetical protein
MWLILNCFVDGLSVMAYGKEPIYSAARKRTKIDKAKDWAEICHFDLHSDNSQSQSSLTFALLTVLMKHSFYGRVQHESPVHSCYEGNLPQSIAFAFLELSMIRLPISASPIPLISKTSRTRNIWTGSYGSAYR